MHMAGLDHVVLTVKSIETTVAFYGHLGFTEVRFGQGRVALQCGDHKLNLHQAGHEFEPKAKRPTPGSADLCFRVASPMDQIMAELSVAGIPIEEGPVRRIGARGALLSVYVRDPDENLIELSNEIA